MKSSLNGRTLFVWVQKASPALKALVIDAPPRQGSVCVSQLRYMADNHFMSSAGCVCYNSIPMSKLNLFPKTLPLKVPFTHKCEGRLLAWLLDHNKGCS